MTQFIRMSKAFARMQIAHAIASLGVSAPLLTESDRDEIERHISAEKRFREAVLKKKQTANKSIQAAGLNNPMNDVTPPTKSIAPNSVIGFLTAIEVAGSDDLKTSRQVVEAHLAEGRIRSFALLGSGVPKRLDPSNFIYVREYGLKLNDLYWPGGLPWFWRASPDSSYCPIAILKDDFDFFIEHARPRTDAESSIGSVVIPPPNDQLEEKKCPPKAEIDVFVAKLVLEENSQTINRETFRKKFRIKFPNAPLTVADSSYQGWESPAKAKRGRPKKSQN